MPISMTKSAPASPGWSGRKHEPWIERMFGLKPGERFEIPEAAVADSTLRSTKMTLWHLSREWGLDVWFQKRTRKQGKVLEVTRVAPGALRGAAGKLAGIKAQVKALAPGETMTVSGEDMPKPNTLREYLLKAGVAMSIRHAQERDYEVLRWRDEHLAVAKVTSPARASRKHLDIESALVALPVRGSVSFDRPATFAARRIARRLNIRVEILTHEGGDVMRVTRQPGPAPKAKVSPLRPWLHRFEALSPGEYFEVTTHALEKAGSSYAVLGSRLSTVAKKDGRRVTLRKTGSTIRVTRAA